MQQFLLEFNRQTDGRKGKEVYDETSKKQFFKIYAAMGGGTGVCCRRRSYQLWFKRICLSSDRKRSQYGTCDTVGIFTDTSAERAGMSVGGPV